MKLSDVAKEYDKAVADAAAANKAAKEAASVKARAKAVLLAKLEEEELDAASATISGKKVVLSKYDIAFAKLEDPEEFRAWAETEDEAYFEPEARVRAELLNALVRQRMDDGEPLPPGVGVYLETRLSRRAQ